MADTPTKPNQTVIGGRHGSPQVTIALPFSKVTSINSQLRDSVEELATLVGRLCHALEHADSAEIVGIGAAAQDLAKEVGALT